MKDEDVKIGMKVVPHNKTTWRNLSKSNAWEKGKERGYLYVTLYNREEEAWVLDQQKEYSDCDGDFFNACDFEPYAEEKKELRRRSIPITILQSENMGYFVEIEKASGMAYTYGSLDEALEKVKEYFGA